VGKTIRFGDLVRLSGRPEPVTLWTDPAKDRPFSKAVRENRVLTINKDPQSTKKEYGQIGFHQGQNALYFVFPRPLPKQSDLRIVGINYQLAENQSSSVQAPPRVLSKPKEIKSEKPKTSKPPKPALKSFKIIVRRTATFEKALTVEAVDESEAAKIALEETRRKRFELNRAIVRQEVLNVSH
jgi:hypothetical protein